ncbi:MAG: Bax inhibitor-1/YccA family protein [Flaviflexus sp.]|nr:Bax inhibitor-1/YccA family protein [Flaviflexus sp.]
MSNPIMSRNPYFTGSTTPAGYPAMPGYEGSGNAAGTMPRPSDPAADAYARQQSYQTDPAAQMPQYGAGGYVEGRAANGEPAMTYDDAMIKTGILLGAALISGALAWALLVPTSVTSPSYNIVMPLAIGTSIGAFVVGMMIAFKRTIGPGLAFAYAILEGVCLGLITGVFELMMPGIALQAVLATACVVGVAWFLHTTGLVKTTPKGMKIVLTIALAGIIFSFVNLGLMVTGLNDQPFGLRSAEIAGIPLGVILGIVMIVVASYMLINDFETVKIAVANRAPKSFAWMCGISIVMTVLWIYMEILRLLAILNRD